MLLVVSLQGGARRVELGELQYHPRQWLAKQVIVEVVHVCVCVCARARMCGWVCWCMSVSVFILLPALPLAREGVLPAAMVAPECFVVSVCCFVQEIARAARGAGVLWSDGCRVTARAAQAEGSRLAEH